jgi:hypothetical protein
MKRIIVALALVGVIAVIVVVAMQMREPEVTAAQLVTSARQNGAIQGGVQAGYAELILHVPMRNKDEADAACRKRLLVTPGYSNMPTRPYEAAFMRACVARATHLSFTAHLSRVPHQQEESMIQIDPDVFAYREDLGYSNETILVIATNDTDVVVQALQGAGQRFMNVDETGAAHPDEESRDSADQAGLYTPNYVSDPKITDAGVEMYVDCKGSIEEPMAEKLRQILRETLEDAGVEARVSAAAQ